MIRPILALLALSACHPLDGEGVSLDPWGPPEASSTSNAIYRSSDGLMELYFTEPGVERDEGEDPELDDAVAALFAQATDRIDLSLFEFDRGVIVDAILDAHDRGVEIRFVGDGDELHDDGYERLVDAGIDLSLRAPNDRIMHNKFAVVDDRFVWTGSTNFSENGVMRNNNGSLRIDSPELAAIYVEEFEQMYDLQLFGRKKTRVDPGAGLSLGATDLQVRFSPADNPHEQLLAALDTADHTVFFMVFAFTRDDVADKLIALHESGVQVVGIFDESQGNGRYSVDEKLAKAGVPVYLDGNENAIGWAGGKLHHKSMLIDAGTPSQPTVTVGSYNWSASASDYNDENMLVLEGAEMTSAYLDQFCSLLHVAVPHPDYEGELPDPCAALVHQVRVNEVMPNPDGTDRGHEWVEIVNTGYAPADLTGWTVADGTAERHTFGPLVLAPGEAVVVSDGDAVDAPLVEVATSGYLGFANNADEVVVRDAQGAVVDRVTWKNAASGTSFNRVPDGGADGDFALHDGGGSSPGWRMDGAPFGGDLIVNELMPNPAGVDADGHEWVELVNAGSAAIDVSGWTLSDLQGERHVFDDGTFVQPRQVVLLYDHGEHDDGIVSSTGFLSLNNSGDTVTLRDARGAVRDEVTYGATKDGVSKTRAVDADRDAALVDHTSVGPELDASPGLRLDGRAWGGRVVVNEVMPDPDGTDAGNEWIEIVNVGGGEAALDGWTMGDAVNPSRHVFTDTVLAPGQALVIFDAGNHPEVPGSISTSSGFLSLNNGGDLVTLHDASGKVHSAVSWSTTTSGVSLVRSVDGDPEAALVPHDTFGAPSSPGTRSDGSDW